MQLYATMIMQRIRNETHLLAQLQELLEGQPSSASYQASA